jgi:hypothetical protein
VTPRASGPTTRLGVVVCQSLGNTLLVAFRFVLIMENASASIGHQPFRQLLRQCLFPALHEPLMQRLGDRFDRDFAPVHFQRPHLRQIAALCWKRQLEMRPQVHQDRLVLVVPLLVGQHRGVRR